MLTNERAELLANYLTDDKERAKALLALDPQEAVAKINANGHDFSVEEITEFGNQMKATVIAQEGELGENALDNVAGGVFVTGAVAGAVAISVAYIYAKKLNW